MWKRETPFLRKQHYCQFFQRQMSLLQGGKLILSVKPGGAVILLGWKLSVLWDSPHLATDFTGPRSSELALL